MSFDPICFVLFVDQHHPIIEYNNNWGDGVSGEIFFLNDSTPIDMNICIEIQVAVSYLIKIGEKKLISFLKDLNCPCNN